MTHNYNLRHRKPVDYYELAGYKRYKPSHKPRQQIKKTKYEYNELDDDIIISEIAMLQEVIEISRNGYYNNQDNIINSEYDSDIENDSDNIINIENYNDSDNIFSDYLYYNNYNKDKPLIIKKLPININKFNPLKYFITIMLLNIIIIFTVIHLK